MLAGTARPPQASASFSHKFTKLILEVLDPCPQVLPFSLVLIQQPAQKSG